MLITQQMGKSHRRLRPEPLHSVHPSLVQITRHSTPYSPRHHRASRTCHPCQQCQATCPLIFSNLGQSYHGLFSYTLLTIPTAGNDIIAHTNPLIFAFLHCFPDLLQDLEGGYPKACKSRLISGSTCLVIRVEQSVYKLSISANMMQSELTKAKEIQDIVNGQEFGGQTGVSFLSVVGDVVIKDLPPIMVKKRASVATQSSVSIETRKTEALYSLSHCLRLLQSIDDKKSFLANIANRLGCFLSYIHANDRQHGDIKAENVMIRLPNGADNLGNWQVVVLDWQDITYSTPGMNCGPSKTPPVKRDELGLVFMIASLFRPEDSLTVLSSDTSRVFLEVWKSGFSVLDIPALLQNNSELQFARLDERSRQRAELYRQKEELADNFFEKGDMSVQARQEYQRAKNNLNRLMEAL
eukprot:gnl/Dysnectes_brevis/10113_a19569_194.p1 GENE.gnl/Dysnectes_brevis/10113_a19569_194~~gnl/Dysnectes_brevis/10113_a19569_194.p1  ORF type:complete len:411 (-),score=27.50 gnl/Dysnectes_brevis/10113_a19569_194:84-1316(-)